MTEREGHYPRTYSERFKEGRESGLRFVSGCACGWRSEGYISARSAQREALQHRMRAVRAGLRMRVDQNRAAVLGVPRPKEDT